MYSFEIVLSNADTRSQEGPNTDKMVFMAEMERDAQRRTKDRKQRDEIGQNLRK